MKITRHTNNGFVYYEAVNGENILLHYNFKALINSIKLCWNINLSQYLFQKINLN